MDARGQHEVQIGKQRGAALRNGWFRQGAVPGTLDQRDQLARAPVSHLVVRQFHRGQCRAQDARDERLVVHADHRQVPPYRQPEPIGLTVGQMGAHIVEAEHAIRTALVEQTGNVTVHVVFIDGQHQAIVIADRRFIQCGPVSGQSFALRDDRHIRTEVGDAPAPGIQQTTGGRIADAVFVRANRGTFAVLVLGVHDDHRQAVELPGNLDLAVVHHGIQEAVGAVLPHDADLSAFQVRIVAGVDGQQDIPQFPRSILRAEHDAPGERRGGDLVADEPEDAAAAGLQVAGHQIGPVAEVLGDSLDLPGDFRFDASTVLAVEHSGDRGDGHACGLGHFLHRHHTDSSLLPYLRHRQSAGHNSSPPCIMTRNARSCINPERGDAHS